jgi:hypothetical protein
MSLHWVKYVRRSTRNQPTVINWKQRLQYHPEHANGVYVEIYVYFVLNLFTDAPGEKRLKCYKIELARLAAVFRCRIFGGISKLHILETIFCFYVNCFFHIKISRKNFARMIDRAKNVARIKASGEGKTLKEGEKKPNWSRARKKKDFNQWNFIIGCSWHLSFARTKSCNSQNRGKLIQNKSKPFPQNNHSCEIFLFTKYFRKIFLFFAKIFRTIDESYEIFLLVLGDKYF